MKNVKTLLIFVALSTFVFASSTRTNALGGAGFWADDYANIWNYPAAVNDHNVAYTSGNNFATIFDHDGTKWGFSGGKDTDEVVNMNWGNGTYGARFGLAMSPEVTAEDVAADNTLTAADAVTGYSFGFGMPLAGGDFGFGYNEEGTISLNHRRAQNVWIWDNMVVGFGMTPEKKAADNNGMFQASNMALGVDCYTVKSYDGGTSALFGLGFAYNAPGAQTDGGTAPDAMMGIEWNFAVESAMTDWATLRLGYSHGYDFANGGTDVAGITADAETGVEAVDQVNGFKIGLGFNYGSFALDMALSSADLLNDPVKYIQGNNFDSTLGAGWTISYNW